MSELDRERGPRLDLTFGTANLASDLEWVLQSSQVEASLVAEALLHSFYAAVSQMAQALEPAASRESPLVRQAFVAALHHRYRFRSGMDATRWFYHIFVDSLPRTTRYDAWPPLAVVLYAFSGLDPSQIAHLLPAPAKEVNDLLQRLDRSPAETLQQSGWEVDENFARGLQTDWRTAFNDRFPMPATDEETLEALAGEIAGHAERQGFLNHRLLTLRELVLIGLAILVMIGILMAANRLLPASEEENQPTAPVQAYFTQIVPGVGGPEAASPTPTTRTRRRWPTPTPVYPAQLPLPLSQQSNSFSIRERLKMAPQLYNTVWADVSLTFYGGSGYEGVTNNQRLQFWISDNQLRLVSGPQDGQPQQYWVGRTFYNGNSSMVQMRDAQNRTVLANIENNDGSFKRFIEGELRLLIDPLRPPLSDPSAETPWDFRVIGTETVAGRSTLIVDQVAPDGKRAARLWLDRDTAFVLRSRYYDPEQPENLVLQIDVKDIRFDIDFVNQRFFDLWHPFPVTFSDGPFYAVEGNWSVVSSPTPAVTPLAAPPAGFDPTSQPLEFVFPADFDLHNAEVPVEIRSNGYSLGKVNFGNPWMMICTRSQDGGRIAFSSRSLLSGEAMTSVGWFDLANLGQPSARLLQGIMASQLAFSPDGSMLAVYGSGVQGRGVYIAFPNQPDKVIFYSENDAPVGLVWNPDSQYLAWVTNPRQGGRQLTVVSPYSQNPLYQSEYTTQLIPSGNSGLEKWQVPLPTPTGGLEDCVRQPVPKS